MVESADEVWAEADLLPQGQEPVIEPEYSRMRKGQVLFTYPSSGCITAVHRRAVGIRHHIDRL